MIATKIHLRDLQEYELRKEIVKSEVIVHEVGPGREISFGGLWQRGLSNYQWSGRMIFTNKAIHITCHRDKPQSLGKTILEGMINGGSAPREVISAPCVSVYYESLLSIRVPYGESYVAAVEINIQDDLSIVLPAKSGPHSFASKIWLLILSQLLKSAAEDLRQKNIKHMLSLKEHIRGFRAYFNAQENELNNFKSDDGIIGVCQLKNNRFLVDNTALDMLFQHIKNVCVAFSHNGYKLHRWLVGNTELVRQTEAIAIALDSRDLFVNIFAQDTGLLSHQKKVGDILFRGETMATIDTSYDTQVTKREVAKLSNVNNLNASTSSAISTGALKIISGTVPKFTASQAEVSSSFESLGSYEKDLLCALDNAPKYFQSFFNDLVPISSAGINDDVVGINCFDEALYCALVKEMHRYTLAEVSANQDELAKSNAGLGAIAGSLLGVITGNIFAPFIGHSYARNMTDRSKRIEEFLPDPNLLFNQDPNSYLAWSRGQVTAPRLRRLIFDRQSTSDGKVYFRALPAIVTADSVYPIQLFKVDKSTYFYRPLAAGINREQAHYDAIKIQRKYFHIRAEGEVSQTELYLEVYGRDIEEFKARMYRFSGQSLDYYYLDFKIQPGCVF
jgi:hypothetical protein